jgi:hypothetical protein
MSDLGLYERLVQVGFERKKKREKSDEEKLATCSMEFLEHLIGHRPYAQ